MTMLNTLETQVDHWAYKAQQHALSFPFRSLRYVISQLLSRGKSQVPTAEIQVMQRRFDRLLAQDLTHVKRGYYPRELLYQMPLLQYLPKYPQLAWDVVQMTQRAAQKNYRDLPEDIDLESYPAYYRRNFHWQTDGYFSRHSAGLYDASVELLFLGTADIMRRQLIAPLSLYLKGQNPEQLRLLDLACGTGRTLLQIAKTHPRLPLTGLDLSPYYIQEARQVLKAMPQVELLQANGEETPFPDGHFDIVTCVYLFHELPRDVRRTILKEMQRLLKPGGLLLLMDSCQLSDSQEMQTTLSLFPQEYHEPYYKDYLRDDLEIALTKAGFEGVRSEVHYLSKLFMALRST